MCLSCLLAQHTSASSHTEKDYQRTAICSESRQNASQEEMELSTCTVSAYLMYCAAHRWKGCFGGCMPSRSSTPSIQSALSTRAYIMLSVVACSTHSAFSLGSYL